MSRAHINLLWRMRRPLCSTTEEYYNITQKEGTHTLTHDKDGRGDGVVRSKRRT